MQADKGGRAWLVCFGNFIILFLETGMVKALGVLLPVLRQQFITQTWIIGCIISLVPGIGAVTCKLSQRIQNQLEANWRRSPPGLNRKQIWFQFQKEVIVIFFFGGGGAICLRKPPLFGLGNLLSFFFYCENVSTLLLFF